MKTFCVVLVTLATTQVVLGANVLGKYFSTTNCDGASVNEMFSNAAPYGCTEYFKTVQAYCKNTVTNNSCCELTNEGAQGSAELVSVPGGPKSVRVSCIPLYNKDCEEGMTEAYQMVSGIYNECPRQCEDDDDDDDKDDRRRFVRTLRNRRAGHSLPKCEAGQEEFGYDKCHVASCKTAVSAPTKTSWMSISSKLKKCPTEVAAQYDLAIFQILHISSACGYLDDSKLLDVSPCLTSVIQLSGMEQNCPRQCEEGNDDDFGSAKNGTDDGKRYCKPGEKEFDPAICGTTRCKAYIERTTKSKLAFYQMVNGFDTCKDTPGLQEYYASFGNAGQYLEASLYTTASGCGFQDSFGFKLDACLNAVFNILSQFDVKCPKQCNEDDEDEDNGLPTCESGQSERTSATCGSNTCKNFLQSIDVPQLYAALNTCKGPLEQYRQYAEQSVTQGELMLKGIGASCGLNLVLTTMPPATTLPNQLYANTKMFVDNDSCDVLSVCYESSILVDVCVVNEMLALSGVTQYLKIELVDGEYNYVSYQDTACESKISATPIKQGECSMDALIGISSTKEYATAPTACSTLDVPSSDSTTTTSNIDSGSLHHGDVFLFVVIGVTYFFA